MDPDYLLNVMEYTMRAQRHVLDALWADHQQLTGHKRAAVKETEPCSACISLAGATQQNESLLVEFIGERKRASQADEGPENG